MEAVNIRAEQLSEVCADSLIPKRQIAILNKKFKMISYQLEQVQRPEEKSECFVLYLILIIVVIFVGINT